MKEGNIRKFPFRPPVCHSAPPPFRTPFCHSARPLVIPHALLSFRTPSCHSAHPPVIPSLPRNPSPFCVVTTSRCFDFAQHDSLFPHSARPFVILHALLSFCTPFCHSEPAEESLSFLFVTTSRCFDFAQHDSLFPHSAHPPVIPSLPGISLTERPFVILHALLSFRACRGIPFLFARRILLFFLIEFYEVE